MKHTVKRLCLCLLLVACFVFSTLLATGCYSVQSGKMRKIVGKYELTTYSTSVDMLVENEIVCTIELREDGTGIYTYQAKNVPYHEGTLTCRYEQDPNNANKYSYVHIIFGENKQEHTFGINVKQGNINFNKPTYKGSILNGTLAVDYYTHVVFTRVKEPLFPFLSNLFN